MPSSTSATDAVGALAAWPVEQYATDPFAFWQRARDDKPVWWNETTNSWLITRYDDVRAVFADNETWSNRFHAKSLGVVFGPTMLQMDGRDHVVRRTIVAPEVVGKRLAGYRELIARNAIELIDRFVDRGSADLVAEYSTWLPVNVIVDMLGMPKVDLPRFHDWYQAMMAGLGHGTAEQRVAGIAAHRALAEYVRPIVRARRIEPGPDFISKIVHAECDGEQLTDAEVEAFISLMLTAGGETTDKALGNLWAQLLAAPDQLERIHADPTRFDDAFGEVMRHSFPIHRQTRTANVDVPMGDEVIRAGDVVSISIGSANNDETVFAEPRRFDLDRPDLWRSKELRRGVDQGGVHGHLGFGLGKHFCLGYEMARMEAVVGSELLLEACPNLEPVEIAPFRIVGATWSSPSVRVRF
ncbi:MAG TPA: cytochrome P450 [Ilumatobacter sp.]